MFGWLFRNYFVNVCEAVLVSSQCLVCKFCHIVSVKFHYIVDVVLDVINVLGQCAVFCMLYIFTLAL